MDSVLFFKNILGVVFKKEQITNFENLLIINNSRTKNLNDFLKFCVIEGIILMIMGMNISSIYLFFSIEKIILIGGICFFIPFFLNYLFQDISFEKRKREKETLLPDLLLEASIFCDENSLLNTIEKISKSDFNLLSKDFERALIEIKKGATIEEALNKTKILNKSRSYDRVIDLLLQSYKSGVSVSDSLKETAEDLLENQAIIKERQAVMLVTKYTLLLACAIIVPGILGLVIGLITGLNFSSIGDIGFGLSPEERQIMFDSAKMGANIYLIEYALLASYFLAIQEGNKKQFFVYLIFLVPISLITFISAQIL
ncbi:MAG TPA: type II secretion system F family protein [archaeon]|nr:type II secretion system F family protein [archaeon]